MPKATLKPVSTAVTVVDLTKPVDLEKLDGSQIGNSYRFEADHLGEIALAMLAHVEGLKKERAMKGILAGVYLQQVRGALGYGPFDSWVKNHLCNSCTTGAGTSRRMAYYYMALAAKFSRSAKLLLPEIIGSNQLTLALEAKGSDAQAFMAKLEKFVGEKGLTDLYYRHGVIKRGGNQRPEPSADAGEPKRLPDSLRPDAEVYGQFVDAVTSAEKILLNDVAWTVVTPDLAARVEPLLKRLLTRYHERILQARHESA